MADKESKKVVNLKPLESGRFELKLSSGKVAELARLNGFEQLAADDYCGGTQSGMRVQRTCGICMLRKVNGIEVAPLSNPLEFENVARSLASSDTLDLAFAYNQLENADESGEALKNESSGAGE